MSNSVDKSKYEHFIPEAKLDPSFPYEYKFILLDNLDELKKVLSNSFDFMGFDTETNGLDPETCFIVGYSFCYDGRTGYYVPVKHFSGGLGKPALDLIYEKLLSCKKVFFANARFDMRFMEYAGYDMHKCNYYDVTLALVLADTNWKQYSLKWAERHFLGWTPDTFAETAGESMNFFYIEPSAGCYYAATDALGTYCLATKSLQFYKEGGISAQLEQMVSYPLMKMEDTIIPIDVKELERYSSDVADRLLELERLIYKKVGYQFRINSNREKGQALASLGISTGSMTRGGEMAVSIKVFQSLEEKYAKIGEEPPEIISWLIEYAQLTKMQSSYINAMITNLRDHDNKGLRFSYKLGRVPTGRLACGKDEKNTYFARINLQSIPKPHPKNWYYRKAVPESDPKYTVYGWEFSLTPFGLGDQERIVEGKDPRLNLRDAFKAGEGRLYCVIDYCIDPKALVELEDGRRVPLTYLDNNPCRIKTPEGYKLAHSFRYTGKKRVCKITLNDGRVIKCSEDHQFKVRSIDGSVSWKKFKDIVDSDYIFTDD